MVEPKQARASRKQLHHALQCTTLLGHQVCTRKSHILLCFLEMVLDVNRKVKNLTDSVSLLNSLLKGTTLLNRELQHFKAMIRMASSIGRAVLLLMSSRV